MMNDIREQIERLRNSKYLLDENCKEVYVSDCARTMEKLLAEIERLTTINKALMDTLDAAIDYTIMRDRETYAALEDAITAATEAYDARQI
jgi:hypothetical protein